MILRMCLSLLSSLIIDVSYAERLENTASDFVLCTTYAPSSPSLRQVLMSDVDHRLPANTVWIIPHYIRSIEKLYGYVWQEDQPSSEF